MEIKRSSGVRSIPFETFPVEQQKRLIQNGIAARSDSFESAPQTNWIDATVGRSAVDSQVSLPASVQTKVEALKREMSDFVTGANTASAGGSPSADLAAAVASLASVVSEIPFRGQIIAAILGIVASVITLVAQMEQKKAEEEVQKKNKAAAQSNDQSSTSNDPHDEAAGGNAGAMMERLTIALQTLQPLFNTGRH